VIRELREFWVKLKVGFFGVHVVAKATTRKYLLIATQTVLGNCSG